MLTYYPKPPFEVIEICMGGQMDYATTFEIVDSNGDTPMQAIPCDPTFVQTESWMRNECARLNGLYNANKE